MEKFNIIFIVMDALRAKNLSCYGYNRKTSPNIDKLAKKGALFENAFSTNNSTFPSFLSIHSGRHLLKRDLSTPIYSEEEIKSFFDSGGVFLQEILKKEGYNTFCLNNLFSWQKKGFDYFWEEERLKKEFKRDSIKYKVIKEIYYIILSSPAFSFFKKRKIKNEVRPEERSGKVLDDAIRIIKENKNKSFFMRVDLDDTHTPYNFPREFDDKFTPHEKGPPIFKDFKNRSLSKRHLAILLRFHKKSIGLNEIISKYDSAIYYDDYLIGQIIKALEENKLLDNTYIFFFSDHGENFMEHNMFFNHNGLYDDAVNVPLIISGPKIPKGKKINSLVQLEDIVPTALDLLGIEFSQNDFDGQSLFNLIKGEKKNIRDSIFLEEILDLKRRGIRTKDYKYIEYLDGSNKIKELYNLFKDPEELNNLTDKNPGLLSKMEKELESAIKSLQKINEQRRISRVLKNIKI